MTKQPSITKKKVLGIKKVKRTFIIGGLLAALAIMVIIIGFVSLISIQKRGTLIIGTTGMPNQIDPLRYIESNDQIIIDQVAETLFDYAYEYNEPKIINTLAIGSNWSDNATEFTCFLRKGVKFHDGTPFNASAVKWNFDRIYRIIDPWDYINYWFGYLFFFPDGLRIVNKTQIMDRYTVKFVLNAPFVPFQSLLTHTVTSILLPQSSLENKTINIQNERIIGTGPFTYGEYHHDAYVSLYRNKNYWGYKSRLDKIVLSFYNFNVTTRCNDLWNDLLARKIHMLDRAYFTAWPTKPIETLMANPKITVKNRLSPNYKFIGMDNRIINITMRKSISYAFNYSYMIKEILNNRGERARSPIPKGILYSNTTFNIPSYNLSKARQILIDAGWQHTSGLIANDNISAGNEWEKLVDDGTPLETYNISYLPGNPISRGLKNCTQNSLKQIGVKVVPQIGFVNPFQLSAVGWGYDYNDPHNAMIDFHSKSVGSFTHLNDSLIDEWIEEGVQEVNPVLRETIYYSIQKRLIEVLYPAVWAVSSYEFDVYVSNLRGWHINPYKLILKTMYFV